MEHDNEIKRVSELNVFIGREIEISLLHKTWSNVVESGKPSVVLIQGDYGVGKTSLVERFLEELSQKDNSMIVASSKCIIDNENNGLIPFNYILVEIFNNKKYRRSIVVGDVLDFAKEIAPAWIDIFTAGVASAAAKTYNEGKKILKPPTAFSQENMFVQFTNIITKVGEKKPLLIHIDDLHWADASSLQLLFHIYRYTTSVPLMIVGTYRPVEALETGQNSKLFKDIRANLLRYGATEVELRDGINVKKYIERRYAQNQFSFDFIENIQKTTEGHALFVSQLLTLLQETGEIYLSGPENNIWMVSQKEKAFSLIPKNIGEVLDQRLQLMTDTLRETLTYASIEGDDFSAQTISKLKKIDENAVYNELEALERQYYLINEQESKNTSTTVFDFYKFAHRFFREHIYKNLSKGRLRGLHKQMGECLEILYDGDIKIAGQLAIHFREAGMFLKAAQYAIVADQQEKNQFAWEESKKWCEMGLVCLSKLSDSVETTELKLELLGKSGEGFYLSGNYAESIQQYKNALLVAQSLNKTAEIARLYERLAEIYDATNHIENALEYIKKSEEMMEGTVWHNSETNMKLSILKATIKARQGENMLAVEMLQSILSQLDELSQNQDILRLKVRAYNWLGVSLSNLGRFTDFSFAMNNALQVSRTIGDDRLVMTILITIVDDFILWSDNISEGESHLEEAISIAKRIGDNKGLAHAQGILGAIFLRSNKIKSAIIELRAAISLNEKTGVLYIQSYFYTFLALAMLKNSEPQEAYSIASQAVKLSENRNHFFWGLSLDVMAQIESEMGYWESAKINFEKAITIHRNSGGNQGVAEAQLHYAKSLISRGEKSEASKLLNEAINIFSSLNVNYSKREAEDLLKLVIGQ